MANDKNIYLDLEDGDDFGFTFADESDIIEENKQYSSLQEQVDLLFPSANDVKPSYHLELVIVLLQYES